MYRVVVAAAVAVAAAVVVPLAVVVVVVAVAVAGGVVVVVVVVVVPLESWIPLSQAIIILAGLLREDGKKAKKRTNRLHKKFYT